MAYEWVVGLLLFAFAAAFFIFALHKFKQKQQTEGWRAHQGRIIELLDIKKNSDESGKWYNVSFRYEYVVDGEVFIGMGTQSDHTERRKRRVKEKYKPGEPVKIYYNPKNPRQSSFSSGTNLNDYILFIFPIIFFFIGLSFF